MSISLGDADFPSTKPGRNPRMPGRSVAANPGVALSRVGNQLLQGRRGTGRQPCPLGSFNCCVGLAARRAINTWVYASVTGIHKRTTMAQLEVAQGKVIEDLTDR